MVKLNGFICMFVFTWAIAYACSDNVHVYTEEGQRPILNFSVVLDTTKDFDTFTVTQYGQNPCLLINYDHGQPLGLPVLQNNCTLAPTADLSRGVLDVKLGPVVAGVQGKYQLSSAFQSNELLKCYTVYLLGIPTSPIISDSGTHYVETSLTLNCSSNSTTSPSNHSLAMTYSWTLGGDNISEGERFSFDTDLRRQLVIANLARNDNQTVIGCSATEGRGYTSQSSVYTIIISYGPENIRFNPTDVSQSYNDGDDFNPVTCLADCHPDCNFSWSKDGTTLTYPKVLDLGVVNAATLGTYTCTATHTIPVHTLTKTLNVSVIYGPDNVSLFPTNESYTLTEGDTLRAIICSATCNPSCRFTWSKSVSTVSSTATLDLGKVVRGEAGSYVCMARNPGSNVSRVGQAVNVTVRYGPYNVSLSSSTTSYTVTEGGNLGPITCSATCNPTCTFTWSMSGVTVSSTATLVFNGAKRGDAGSYICTARNPGTNVLKEGPIIAVNVRYGPSSVTLSPSTLNFTENEGYILAPITCSADCFPECNILWRRTSEVSDFVSYNASLSLSELNRTERGTYKCEATNPDTLTKNTSHEVTVNVRYGPDRVTLNVTNIHTVTEGDAFNNIKCLADCWPSCDFTWTNLTDNQTISSSAVLVFETSDRYNAGDYKCLAMNSAYQLSEEAETTFTLYIQYAPDVSIIQSTAILNEHIPLDLLCKASGVPAVYNYTGFVQRVGDVVVPNRYVQSPGVKESISINIPSLHLQDTGIYTCYVQNGITGLNKQLIQTALRSIDVSASPQFLLEKTIVAGETSGNITISIPFFSFPAHNKYRVLRHNGQPISSSGKYNLQIRNASVYTLFYGKQVTLAGNILEIIISDLSANDFGIYKIQIANDINTANLSIDLKATSKPSPPTELNLTTLDSTVTFEWTQGFNGGYEQTFVLQTLLNSDDSWKNQTTIKESESKNIKENGRFQVNLTNLVPGMYSARLVAFNIIGAAGFVAFKEQFAIKELDEEKPGSSSGALIGGAAGGGLGVTVLTVVAVIIFLKKRKTQKGRDDSDRLTNGQKLAKISHRTGQADDNIPDEVENPMYVSGDDFDIPKVTTADIYATPDKKRPKQNTGAGDIYAVVDKKKKNQDIYENSDNIPMHKGVKSAGKKKRVNNDGLVYADLVFANPPKGQKKLVIHGIDDMTEYAEVDLTKRADPLPDSDDDQDKK